MRVRRGVSESSDGRLGFGPHNTGVRVRDAQREGRTTNSVVRRGVIATALAGAALDVTAPAQGAPPEYPHGVGVCMSQVAINPEFLGAENLGAAVRDVKGADVKAASPISVAMAPTAVEPLPDRVTSKF